MLPNVARLGSTLWAQKVQFPVTERLGWGAKSVTVIDSGNLFAPLKAPYHGYETL